MKNKTEKKILAVAFALCVWQAVAWLVGADFLLASPVAVVRRLVSLMGEGDFWTTLLFSFLRIGAGFGLALIFGLLAAVAAGRFPAVEILLWPFVLTAKAVPIASFIILFLLWFTFGQLTVFIALLIAFPVIYTNVLQGIKSTDAKLTEVARLYRVPFRRRLLYLYWPSVQPFLLSAGTVAIGMAWKAGVAAEVIGVVSGSIGGKLYDAKIYFQNADLLAWTVMILLLSVACEKGFSALLGWLFGRVTRR